MIGKVSKLSQLIALAAKASSHADLQYMLLIQEYDLILQGTVSEEFSQTFSHPFRTESIVDSFHKLSLKKIHTGEIDIQADSV